MLVARARSSERVPLLDPRWRAIRSHGGFSSRAAAPRATTRSPGATRAPPSALGVDIIQNCEVTGLRSQSGRRDRRRDDRAARSRAASVVLAVAGHSERARGDGRASPADHQLCAAGDGQRAGQAAASTRVVLSPAVHVYVSQSDKRRDRVRRRRSTAIHSLRAARQPAGACRTTVAALVELFPALQPTAADAPMGRHRRHHAGLPARSSARRRSPDLYLNCGWGTGGFKAIPAGGETMAARVATGTPHPLIGAFRPRRFARGALIDEGAAAGVAH